MNKLNWRDASKELPEDDYACLVCTKDKAFFVACFWIGKWFGYAYEDVAYWIPVDELTIPED